MRSITLVIHVHALDFETMKMKVLAVDFMWWFFDLMDNSFSHSSTGAVFIRSTN